MTNRFRLFQDGGVPKTYVEADYFGRRVVIRREVLALPAKALKSKGRKTIDVGGRILTLSLLHEVDTSKEERKESLKRKLNLQAKRAKKKAGRGKAKAAVREVSGPLGPLLPFGPHLVAAMSVNVVQTLVI
ncbi:hypothetical protein B5M09_008656 [Aphanomyces astaci]|uniref:Uncharacterized protein n=1 Tax=Aphanomyces astaci TaxID=112090 RepID=A0A425DNZ7_APHAT|nr:hypothetical protein B5M09_008656 [Aphanomyces astaci]